jgi:hypothetical protein
LVSTGVEISQIEGNIFTTAAVDADFKFFFGVEEIKYLGMVLGLWKPGGSALLSPLTLVPGHWNDCS